MEFDNGFFFLLGEIASLDIRTEIVDPSKAAALSAPQQACKRMADLDSHLKSFAIRFVEQEEDYYEIEG